MNATRGPQTNTLEYMRSVAEERVSIMDHTLDKHKLLLKASSCFAVKLQSLLTEYDTQSGGLLYKWPGACPLNDTEERRFRRVVMQSTRKHLEARGFELKEVRHTIPGTAVAKRVTLAAAVASGETAERSPPPPVSLPLPSAAAAAAAECTYAAAAGRVHDGTFDTLIRAATASDAIAAAAALPLGASLPPKSKRAKTHGTRAGVWACVGAVCTFPAVNRGSQRDQHPHINFLHGKKGCLVPATNIFSSFEDSSAETKVYSLDMGGGRQMAGLKTKSRVSADVLRLFYVGNAWRNHPAHCLARNAIAIV